MASCTSLYRTGAFFVVPLLLAVLTDCAAHSPRNSASTPAAAPDQSSLYYEPAPSRATALASAQEALDALRSAQIHVSLMVALALRVGATVWLTFHESCPTAEEILQANYISDVEQSTDSWHQPYSITCNDAGPVVRSAGPDGLLGTPDDIIAGEP